MFAELAAHHDKVDMRVADLPNGVEVTSTSEDPEVRKLILAHARKVSQMAEHGPAAAREPASLPEDYRANEGAGPAPDEAMAPGQGRGNGRGYGRGHMRQRGQGQHKMAQAPRGRGPCCRR